VKVYILATRDRRVCRQHSKLKLPKAAVSRFLLKLPEEGFDFEITPKAPHTLREAGGATEFQFFSGAGSEFDLAWEKPSESGALEPLVFADANLDVHVDRGSVTTKVAATYQIHRTGLDRFELFVPAPHEVIKVTGAGIKTWDLETVAEGGDNGQLLVVQLHEPAKNSYALSVVLEAPVEALPATANLPEVEARNVKRQRGRVSLTANRALDAQISRPTGLSQEAGAGMAQPNQSPQANGTTNLGTFRYLKNDFGADLDIRQATPVVEVESFTLTSVEPDLVSFDSRFVYNVKRVGIFGTSIALPSGYSAIDVTGAVIEDFHVEGEDDGEQTVEITFKTQALGAAEFTITGRHLRDAEDEALTVPALRPADVRRHEGKVGLEIHTSLDPNTTDIGGFRQQDIGSLAEKLKPSGKANVPLTLGFRYRDDAQPAELGFTLKKPQVSGDILTLTEIQEQLVRHHWQIDLQIRYAGIEAFIVAVPTAIADELRHDETQVKEIVKGWTPETPAEDADPDADVIPAAPAGTTYWRIVLRDKKLGPASVELTFEMPFPNVRAGEATTIPVPELQLINVFRETGQIAVLKDGNLEVLDADSSGLEEIDPKELRGDLSKPGVFLAYKYKAHPIGLDLSVSKNEFLAVPPAVVTYADVVAAVSTDRGVVAEVVYWVKNNARQFLAVQLPEGGEMLSDVFVRGEPQQPMRRANSDEMLVRLPSGSDVAEAAFPIRFVYSIPSPDAGSKMGAFGRVQFVPAQIVDARVLESQLELHLPADYVYPRFRSAMRRSVGERGWASFRRMTDWLIPALGPNEERGHRDSHIHWKAPPELPADQSAGFDFEIPAGGQKILFHRLGSTDSVRAGYRSRTWAFTVDALACLLAFMGGLLLLRKPKFLANLPWLTKTLYFCILGLGSLVIAGAIQPGSAGFWRAIFLGVLLAALVWLVIGLWKFFTGSVRRIRDRRDTRLKETREYALKGLQGSASPTAVAASTTPAPELRPVDSDDSDNNEKKDNDDAK